MPHVPDLSGSALDDRYELHALIGEGAFGRVYAGRDRRLDRPVAVKVIKPWWAEDPEWVADFERETRLLARVSDPGIVQIYDVGHAPEGRYYVSELVAGENLAQRLARGPLAPWQAAGIAAQLCRALAGAHAQRIVHRDVKPPNVLLSAADQVKVGDFGVAGLAEGSSGGGSATIVGTPGYMAPEQSRGRPVSPATDVYSAGVVLYEMLAGSRPFVADSPVDLALCHLQDPPPPLPGDVPESLAQIVDRALAKEPSRRYRDGGEMADALIDARRRAGEGVRARPERPGSRPARPAGRQRGVTEPAAKTVVLAQAGAAAGAGSDRAAGADRGTGPDPTLTRPTAVAGARPGSRPRRVLAPPTPTRRPGQRETAHRSDDTRHAPRVSPRSEHNPPARRRAAAVLLAGFGLLGAMVAAALVIGSGTGSNQRSAPALTSVPVLTGMTTAAAEAKLKAGHLQARTVAVPWPGHAPGTVRGQSSVARRIARGSRVTLDVAEVPSWRTVGSFSSTSSPVYLIQGSHFRLVYSAQSEKSCALWIFLCSSTSVQVTDTATGSTVDTFDLSDGSHGRQDLATGPGDYQVKVDPASGDARWSFAVQDWY